MGNRNNIRLHCQALYFWILSTWSALSLSCLLPHTCDAFVSQSQRLSPQPQRRRRQASSSAQQRRYSAPPYGRGSEIWPPTNEDAAIALEDSFPHGIVPTAARDVFLSNPPQTKTATSEATPLPNVASLRSTDKWIRRIPWLRRNETDASQAAATASAETLRHDAPRLNRRILPAALAVTMLRTGAVPSTDVLVAAVIAGYAVVLQAVARSFRADGRTPIMPTLPPSGHLPHAVAWPLQLGGRRTLRGGRRSGGVTARGAVYDAWLGLGVVVGFVAPAAVVGLARMLPDAADAAAGSPSFAATIAQQHAWLCRHLFLLAVQALSEAAWNRPKKTPLPIRIYLPLAFNAVRLPYLWQWTMSACLQSASNNSSSPTMLLASIVAAANLVYWSANWFGFLVPIALVRYMRAHFFAVEAAAVTTRSGLEETLGLLPPATDIFG